MWFPAIISLIFVGIYLLARRSPFRRTPFDLVLVLFLVMALVGLWAAYNRQIALDKFLMLVLAIMIYYAIASQPSNSSRLLIGLISVIGVLLSLHFLLYDDWRTLPADFRIITRLGLSWMAVRPQLQGQALTPNITAGVLAGFFPFTLAFGLIFWQRRSIIDRAWLPLTIAGCITGLQALAIFMTSSRGAWFALMISLGLWVVWRFWYKFQAQLKRLWKPSLVIGGITLGILAGLLIFIQASDPARIIDLAPGLPVGQSREGIDSFTLRLIRDFPITGGGLGAFPGLFSQYMLVIPNLMFEYSHNMYLDVALEQGLPGLLAFLVILVCSGLLLLRAPRDEDVRPGLSLLRQAAFVSLVVMLIHGVIDDAYYGVRGTPFLWVIAGLAVYAHPDIKTLAGIFQSHQEQSGKIYALKRWKWLAWGSISLAVIFTCVITWRQLAAGWLANLGAVHMAQVQLSDFPNDVWRSRDIGASLDGARILFENALSLDPANQTALYRLGLIAMQNQDYPAAAGYLEAAYRQDVGHRGVKKNLGYAYVWGGEFEPAQAVLGQIPEARYEMEILFMVVGDPPAPGSGS